MTANNEAESPVLKLNTYGDPIRLRIWENRRNDPWCCFDQLKRLFEIDPAKNIVFVAKSKADKTTYEAALYDEEYIVEPINSQLYPLFGMWLKKQIKAGRPNIGVRIIQ
jgi:hypothetical protein